MNYHSLVGGQPFRKSILAMCIFAASYPALAAEAEKDAAPASTDEIIITGMRANLNSAQEIKRNADTVVDAITAEDLGSFPDKSVAEALQRVPGITISRFADTKRSYQFSADPSGVMIRGLGYSSSQFNGREAFSATSSRGLSWGDVSPELVGGVDIYKNLTAELIEGGISGTVNLRTRLPFDSEGETKAFSFGNNYNSETGGSSPEISGIYTNRWQTSAGEFGFMGNLAYSDTTGASNGQNLWKYRHYQGLEGMGTDLVHIPEGVNFSQYDYSRQRIGQAFAFQWQDDEGKYLASLQFNRSDYTSESTSYNVGTGLATWQNNLTDVGKDQGSAPKSVGTAEFDSNGALLKGTFVKGRSWHGSSDAESMTYAKLDNGLPVFQSEGCDWGGCKDPAKAWVGQNIGTGAGWNKQEEMIQDLSFNFKWNISDTVHAAFDAQYVDATRDQDDASASLTTYANPTVDFSSQEYKMILNAPSSINMSNSKPEAGIFGNFNNYAISTIDPHFEHNKGNEFAAKADVIFDVDSGYIQKIKAGVRYANREQEVNQAGNWSMIYNQWASNTADWYNLDSPAKALTKQDGTPLLDDRTGKPRNFTGYPLDYFQARQWDSKWGQVTTADGKNNFVFPKAESLKYWNETMTRDVLGAGELDSLCSGLGNRAGLVPGKCYKPNEQLQVTEQTEAAYVQVNFGGEDLTVFDRPLTGNVGVRLVQTKVESVGGESFPSFASETKACADAIANPPVVDPTKPPPLLSVPVGCIISADDIAFGNNGYTLGTSNATHTNILPSLNFKYEYTDKFQSHLAISRGMSRPDIGSLRNYIGVGKKLPEDTLSDPRWIKDPADPTKIIGLNVNYEANASNPYLKPMTADQADLTFEYYFSKAGNVSVDLFSKNFHDYIFGDRYVRSMTNNGVTKDVIVSGPVNGDGGQIRGIELQGTRFFDFLPSPFDGLGASANFTYIENNGIENTGIDSASSDGAAHGIGTATIKTDGLEGMSKTSYSASLMYEKYGFSSRIAYSWRSEYLLSAADCCVDYPTWSKEYGQLDASVHYNINSNYEIGLSVSNLSNEHQVIEQQITNSADGGLRLPSSVAISEQRYTLSFRGKF